MNKAQKYLIDNSLADLVLNQHGEKTYTYASDAMMQFSERQSPCKFSCESKAFEIELRSLRAALIKAADDLDKAAIEVEEWGAYASDYFREKHDLSSCAKAVTDNANAARARAF